MKSFAKRFGALTAVGALAVSAIAGSGIVLNVALAEESETDYSDHYFFDQLKNDPLAQNFYKAFDTLAENGEFKKGKVEYDLVANGVATKDQVTAYVNNSDSSRLARSYGAGRDAFYMDHPDLFYLDIFSTSISAGMKGSDYVAYLDSSRALNTYNGNLDSEAKVNTAIEAYEAKIGEIVAEANEKSTVKEKIEYVNEYIAENNTYGFGTEVQGDRNVDTPKADYIYTSYGALINNESVCEGYAKSFKAVMDRLGIPCACVSGSADGDRDGKYEPHMWNAVQVDGLWYGVDVTYNATGADKNEWTLVGGQKMNDTHISDGVVSTSGYELRYPALKPYEYGNNTDDNGMVIVGEYVDDGSSGYDLKLVISCDDKGALKLEEEGKYLAFRMGLKQGSEIEWQPWANFVAYNEAMKLNIEGDYFKFTDNDTTMEVASHIEYLQFALLSREPDAKGTDLFTMNSVVAYDPANLTQADFIGSISAPYHNNGYGSSEEPAPFVLSVSPYSGAALPVDQSHEIKIKYTDELELEANKTVDDIEIDFIISRGNDIIKENATATNVKWEGDTVTFTFTPSKMYVHNEAWYYFTPTCLVGKKSQKTPNAASFSFGGQSIICNKMLPGGQLYMKLYGQPMLLDDSDVSATNFKDENDRYFAESQRSQLILVASKPNSAQEQKMDEVLKEGTGIEDKDIVSSSSYEINLQICGVVPKIPNGTYFQVAFGFPEGYDPNDEGTTYKIYHYKTDTVGNIIGVEEIPVIINQYGLIAKVPSFSPFTVVQVKKDSAAVTNSDTVNVYAYVNGGTGGTITTDGKSGISEVKDSITYDIKADDGFTIACVRLNGKVLDASYYSDGKLTLDKDDIESSNMLEVQFMNAETASAYASQGITLSYGTTLDGTNPDYAPDTNSNSVTVIVICVVVAVVALAGGALIVWWIFFKKKPAEETATAQPKAKQTTVKKKTVSEKPKKEKTAKDSAKQTKTAAKPKKETAAKKSTKPTSNSKKK